MKTIGWLRSKWDFIVAIGAFVCFLAYLQTTWPLFLAAAVVLGAVAMAYAVGGTAVFRRSWRRSRTGWSDGHPAVRAAKQREEQMLEQWWELPAADDEVRKEQR